MLVALVARQLFVDSLRRREIVVVRVGRRGRRCWALVDHLIIELKRRGVRVRLVLLLVAQHRLLVT